MKIHFRNLPNKNSTCWDLELLWEVPGTVWQLGEPEEGGSGDTPQKTQKTTWGLEFESAWKVC